jgi:hypothetical protein
MLPLPGRLRPQGVGSQSSTLWVFLMVSILVVLKFLRDACPLGQARKEAAMNTQTCRSATLETIWAIGTSFTAGCLST